MKTDRYLFLNFLSEILRYALSLENKNTKYNAIASDILKLLSKYTNGLPDIRIFHPIYRCPIPAQPIPTPDQQPWLQGLRNPEEDYKKKEKLDR